jgi:ABC-type Fe3+/spermidine/putrescine transport system ATPase subunit
MYDEKRSTDLKTTIKIEGLVKRFGDFTAVNRVSFEVGGGEFVTLLGPSGCGKTTILRMIAGFAQPDAGRVLFNDRVMNNVAVHQRNTAMVFQSYALFPHKTVYENIRFGLRMKHVPLEEQQERIKQAMEMVNLKGLEQRKPYELSGGQQQRVALARAIVVQPQVMLFDEPLSNLDAKLRERVRDDIRMLQDRLKFTSIYVTHDQSEALAISDAIIVMRKGEIIQMADPRTVYNLPANKFVANFIGVANLIDTEVLECANGIALLQTPVGRIRAAVKESLCARQVSICMRPEDFVPGEEAASTQDMNVITGTVENVIFMGSMLDIMLSCCGVKLRAHIDKSNIYKPGQEISLAIPPQRVRVMEDTGNEYL